MPLGQTDGIGLGHQTDAPQQGSLLFQGHQMPAQAMQGQHPGQLVGMQPCLQIGKGPTAAKFPGLQYPLTARRATGQGELEFVHFAPLFVLVVIEVLVVDLLVGAVGQQGTERLVDLPQQPGVLLAHRDA